MSRSVRTRLIFWSTPGVAVLLGLVFLWAAAASGHPALGAVLLAIMVLFGAGLVLASGRSETIRGLLDRKDERITTMDLRATAAAGVALMVAVAAGAVVELARGHSGAPYTWLAVVSAFVYLGALVIQRARG